MAMSAKDYKIIARALHTTYIAAGNNVDARLTVGNAAHDIAVALLKESSRFDVDKWWDAVHFGKGI